jgi:hypothetical protein
LVTTGFLEDHRPNLLQCYAGLNAVCDFGSPSCKGKQELRSHRFAHEIQVTVQTREPGEEQPCGRIVEWRYRGVGLFLITPMLCAKCGVVRMPPSQYAKPKEETVQPHAVPRVLGTSQRHTVIPCRLQLGNTSRTTQESSRQVVVLSSRNARYVAIGCNTYIKRTVV